MKNRINKKTTHTPPNRPVRRWTFLLILMAWLTIGCQETARKTEKLKQATLVVQLHDFSKSTEPITYFDTVSGVELYYGTALNGGGTIKHIAITEASEAQDVFTLNVRSADTAIPSDVTNVYQKAKAKSRSLKAFAEFQKQAGSDMERYCKEITKPHNKQFTDLASALSLAVATLQQENFSQHRKFLLLCSDMIHDPKDRKRKLNPVELQNTTVVVIRPAITLDSLKSLFPGSPVFVFTSAHDAITFINNSKN